ncbi:hypothetical protein [Commensalibacter communis]|nr:hypothetical protein [Commensalibacter communis]
MQLFSGVEKACKNRDNCQIHLQEIMPFQWDKAYFFLEENGYSNYDIKSITGTKGDFDLGRRDVLILFKYHNHLVKYQIFEVYDHTDLKFSFSLWGGVNKTVAIGFMMGKSSLNELHYSGDINQFNDTVYIKYYEITPDNDLLDAGCDTDKYFQGTIKTCFLGFTNLKQVYLEKPYNKQE